MLCVTNINLDQKKKIIKRFLSNGGEAHIKKGQKDGRISYNPIHRSITIHSTTSISTSTTSIIIYCIVPEFVSRIPTTQISCHLQTQLKPNGETLLLYILLWRSCNFFLKTSSF